MIHPVDYLERILARTPVLAPNRVKVTDALGRALAHDVAAPEDHPPFANSGMDGFAVRAADTERATGQAPTPLTILGDLPAGRAAAVTVTEGTAVRVMTGAPIPDGADAVVPVEDTQFWDGTTRFARAARPDEPVRIAHPARAGQNIRRAGESVRRGDVCVHRGDRVRPAETALLLSLGITEIDAHPLPRVGVLSTGDELVDANATPGPGQIRDSNRAALLAAVAQLGFTPVDLGLVRDDPDELERRIRDALPGIDMLVTSGGVSVGDYDFTRRVLTRLGDVEGYAVAVKPGKPQVFGRIDDTVVFGLPGNPVSSLVVFDVFAAPVLRTLAGRRHVHPPLFSATLAGPVRHQPGRTEVLRVRLEATPEGFLAHGTGPQGSGVLTSMTRADGYAMIPADVGPLDAGTVVSCRWIHWD